MTREAGPYTSGDVAEMFGVDRRTVKRWATTGRIRSFPTLGGHARFDREYVDRLLEDQIAGHLDPLVAVEPDCSGRVRRGNALWPCGRPVVETLVLEGKPRNLCNVHADQARSLIGTTTEGTR